MSEQCPLEGVEGTTGCMGTFACPGSDYCEDVRKAMEDGSDICAAMQVANRMRRDKATTPAPADEGRDDG